MLAKRDLSQPWSRRVNGARVETDVFERRSKHDPVPPSVDLSLDETFRVLEALEDGLDALRRNRFELGLQDEIATVIRMLHSKLHLDEGGFR